LLNSANFHWGPDSSNLVSPVVGNQDVILTHTIDPTVNSTGSTLSVTPNGPIYTSSSYTVTVTANDQSTPPNPQPNIPIKITATGGTLASNGVGTFDPATGICTTSSVTATLGQCQVTWTSTAAGTFNVAATYNGTAIGGSPQSRVFYTKYDPTKSELTTDTNSVSANGTDHATLTVTLKDAGGAVTKSAGTTTVTFSKGAGEPGTFNAATCDILENNSSCFVTISSTTTGTAHVTAKIDNVAVNYSPLDISFGNTPISCTNSTLEANPQSIEANGTNTSTVTVTLRDSTGNLISAPTNVTFPALPAGQGTVGASCQTPIFPCRNPN